MTFGGGFNSRKRIAADPERLRAARRHTRATIRPVFAVGGLLLLLRYSARNSLFLLFFITIDALGQ